jgi:hypothetical protein
MHIIATATYGSHRVRGPRTGHKVSAHKIGYTSAASAVLLALYGQRARDVSSKQASYHYIQIDGEVTVRHGYILLKVSDDELTRAESITIRSHRPDVYRWLDGAWHELPNKQSAHYQPVTGRSGLDFNPTGLLIATTDGAKETGAAGVITAEQSQRDGQRDAWWWLHGDTYPHRDLLKRWGCRWSKKRRCWYFIGETLPDAVQALIDTSAPDDDAPCSDEEAERILGVKLAPHSQQNGHPLDEPPASAADIPETASDEPEHQHIRIIKPDVVPAAAEPDAVQTAIQRTKAQPLTTSPQASTATGKRALASIPQEYVGELTGSISGNVWCYGYAVHDGICVYLNCGGPRMAVEAIRARLAKGEIVNCVPMDAPAIELTAGEGNTGMYTAYLQSIPEAKFASLILVHEQVVNPNYGGKSTTFILRVSEEQAMAQLRHHVTELVKVPVFDEWAGYLWQAGQSAMLVRRTRGAGGLDVLCVDLDAEAWTRLITGGLSQGVIALPN